MELSKNTGINKNTIELIMVKERAYRTIYSLNLVKLENLKAYIKTHSKTGLIRLSKSSIEALIFFYNKSDQSLCLFVDYRGLSNLTIENRYPFLLIGESLNRLSRTKRFTQLSLTSTYHWMRIRKGDEEKTVYCTNYGQFKYQVIRFGLYNALASFQGYINKILTKNMDIFVLVYLKFVTKS